jgi:hypothetical protein
VYCSTEATRLGHSRADCHCQEGVAIEGLALNLPTDFVSVCFQENLDFMRLVECCLPKRNTDSAKQLNLFNLTGHYWVDL